MKEKLITLGLAVCALGLFWILMFPRPQSGATVPHPLSTGADPEGYLALSRWLSATGVPTLDLHQRFPQLGDNSISRTPTGNLLITTLPYAVAARPEEFPALAAWVGKGNALLVIAALDDTPLWSALTDNFLPELQRLTGIKFTSRQEPDTNAIAQATQNLREALTPAGREIGLIPSGRIGVLGGVNQLATHSALPSTQWQAAALDPAPVLELARRADTADPVLWMKASGDGTIIVSAYASLFSNDVIGKAGNARLLSNIIAFTVHSGGRVIIDDAHQGAMAEYDAAKFFADPRLHHTLWWLVLLWLGWVAATQPLRAAPRNIGTLDESAMLRTTAGFLAGVLRPVASAQWLLEEFFDRLRRRHGLLHSSVPPWDWLAAHAGVGSTTLAELRELYIDNQAGRRVSLVRLQRLISQISGQTS